MTGLEVLPQDERTAVLERFELREGDVFVEASFEASKDSAVEALLGALGYAEAKVETRATVDLGTREATVRVAVEPGPRYRFGAVQVTGSGADVVEPWRIEELVGESIEGEAFYSPQSTERRTAANRRARRLRRSEGGGRRGDPQARTVPVVVDVTDAPLRELALGGGLGVEQLRWNAGAVARFTHHNFLGGLRQLSTEARAGWRR